MYKIASILPANIPIKMAIINMYKTILVSDTISLIGLTDENRTHNHQNHNLMLYQLSYRQHLVGREGVEPSQSQTADLQSVGLATCSASPLLLY